MPQKVADGVNSVLSGVMDATGMPARIPGGYPQAGKTGTTDAHEAAWFDGYTPQAAGVAMIAADGGNSYFRGDKSRSIKGIRTSTGVYLNGSGGSDAGKIYRAAMAGALQGKPKTEFVAPTDEVRYGKLIKIPDTDGMTYPQAKAAIRKAGFHINVWHVWDDSEPDTYLGTDPQGSAHAGATVTLKVSKGPKPAPKPTYAPALPPQNQPNNPGDEQPGDQQNPPGDQQNPPGGQQNPPGGQQNPPGGQQNPPGGNAGGNNGGGQQNPPGGTRTR